MRLLFDENLSPSLIRLLSDLYPHSMHVLDLPFFPRTDRAIRDWAARNGFVIVTQDDDLRELSLRLGAPPKVLLLAIGNSRTERIADLLRREYGAISAFERDERRSLLRLQS